MLNRTMNKALETIANMSIEEKMLYMSICFEETIMDKDYLIGEDTEVPCVITYNTKIQKPKDFNPKFIRKDKAKAGYHNGARNEGWGHYDRWLKPERVVKDQTKDLKAQMMELGELPDNITVNEGAYLLASIYDMSMFEKFNMDMVFYHSSKWYDNLNENIHTVEEIYQEYMDKLLDLQVDLYQSVDNLFPEMGMGFQNMIVEKYISMVMDHLDSTKNRMIYWLVSMYKDNREYEQWEEELRHNAEMTRLNKLMTEANNLLKETEELMK